MLVRLSKEVVNGFARVLVAQRMPCEILETKCPVRKPLKNKGVTL
jgi:hypothetical protein